MELKEEKTHSWVKVACRDLVTVRDFDGKERERELVS